MTVYSSSRRIEEESTSQDRHFTSSSDSSSQLHLCLPSFDFVIRNIRGLEVSAVGLLNDITASPGPECLDRRTEVDYKEKFFGSNGNRDGWKRNLA